MTLDIPPTPYTANAQRTTDRLVELAGFAAWVAAATEFLRPEDLERFRREVRRRAEALGVTPHGPEPEVSAR